MIAGLDPGAWWDTRMEYFVAIFGEVPLAYIYVTLRIVTLVVLLGAIIWKIYVMERLTKKWDTLGRAMRMENLTYLVMWVWFLLVPTVPHLRHPIFLVLLELALIAVTITVVKSLPRVPLLLADSHRLAEVDRELAAAERVLAKEDRVVAAEQREVAILTRVAAESDLERNPDDPSDPSVSPTDRDRLQTDPPGAA